MSDEDEAAVERTIERLARIDATFAGWEERVEAWVVLMDEGAPYFEAQRRYIAARRNDGSH